jgi:hypothetical protein
LRVAENIRHPSWVGKTKKSINFYALRSASRKLQKKLPNRKKAAQRTKKSGKQVFDNRLNGFLVAWVFFWVKPVLDFRTPYFFASSTYPTTGVIRFCEGLTLKPS